MQQTMKRILASVLLVFAVVLGHAQGSMNIYQTNGSILQIALSSIDSVTYTVTPPPLMRIHQAGGSVLSLAVAQIDSITYSTGGAPGTAQVATLPATAVGSTTAVVAGTVSDDGGAAVTARGICYGTNPMPTLSGPSVSAGSGLGGYEAQLSGLLPSTSYYARAYATNAQGTAYGNQVQFTTLPYCIPTSSVVEDFATTLANVDISNLACWINATEAGTRRWRGNNATGDLCAQATAFQSASPSDITWLIGPPVSHVPGMTLSFRSQRAFGVSGHDPFAVFISTNYNIDNLTTANWVNIPCDYATPSTADQVWVNSGVVDLSALLPPGYSGSFVIGFRYTGSGPTGQTTNFRIDDVMITGGPAALTTLPVGNITATSASTGGSITSDGGSVITARGVCWSTSPNPTTANSTTNDGSGVGGYTSNLSGLVAGATYYVRAYAINSAGTSYGNEVQFTTAGGGGSIESNPGAGVTFDGYSYPSVVLGNGQEWMAENLRTTTFANGDPIPNVTDDFEWGLLTTAAWAHGFNNSSYENPFGKLYNWYAVADPRNVCPTGWHVPTDAEWNTLVGYLDAAYDPSAYGNQSATAGGKMKSTGTEYWADPNVGATNESGFSGLPGGNRGSLDGGWYGGVGTGSGTWWSASEAGTQGAWFRYLYSNGTELVRMNIDKRDGRSVRCLRD
jgi:uncharacterized protein (TIGR02145 family)